MSWLSHLDDYGGWLAAVVAGLVALGWLAKKARNGARRLMDVARKIDTLEELAVYELNHNGGNSIKDRVAQIPKLDQRLQVVEKTLKEHLAARPATTVVVAPVSHEEV